MRHGKTKLINWRIVGRWLQALACGSDILSVSLSGLKTASFCSREKWRRSCPPILLPWFTLQNISSRKLLGALFGYLYTTKQPWHCLPETSILRRIYVIVTHAPRIPFLTRASQANTGVWQLWTARLKHLMNAKNHSLALASMYRIKSLYSPSAMVTHFPPSLFSDKRL